MEKMSGELSRALSDMAKAKRMLAEARRKLARLSRPGGPAYLVEKQWQWAHELMESRCEKILSYPNVVGYGLGFRVRKGERTDTPCLTVYVRKKKDEKRMRPEAKLPKSIRIGKRRLPVDVVEIGKLKRQLGPGDSIGDPTAEKGTLGAFALDTSGRGDVVGLTAMHLTSLDEFPDGVSDSPQFESPCPGDGCGQLRAGSRTGIDAAVLELTDPPPDAITDLPFIGRVRGWRRVTFPGDKGSSVRLFGAILVDIDTDDGDSGCALVDRENLVLGFLVGRGDSEQNNLAVFTPASLVLSRLHCDIPKT